MFTSMLVPISVVDNSIDMIEIAESTSVGYALTCKTIFLTIGRHKNETLHDKKVSTGFCFDLYLAFTLFCLFS